MRGERGSPPVRPSVRPPSLPPSLLPTLLPPSGPPSPRYRGVSILAPLLPRRVPRGGGLPPAPRLISLLSRLPRALPAPSAAEAPEARLTSWGEMNRTPSAPFLPRSERPPLPGECWRGPGLVGRGACRKLRSEEGSPSLTPAQIRFSKRSLQRSFLGIFLLPSRLSKAQDPSRSSRHKASEVR